MSPRVARTAPAPRAAPPRDIRAVGRRSGARRDRVHRRHPDRVRDAGGANGARGVAAEDLRASRTRHSATPTSTSTSGSPTTAPAAAHRRLVLAVGYRRRLRHPRPGRDRDDRRAGHAQRWRVAGFILAAIACRGRHLSRHHVRDPPRAAERAAARPSPGRRELLLRPHRRIGRRLLRRRAADHKSRSAAPPPNASSGWSRSRSPFSSPSRGCTGACTIPPTSPPASLGRRLAGGGNPGRACVGVRAAGHRAAGRREHGGRDRPRPASAPGRLPELRRALARHGVRDPLWVEVPKSKRAPKQVRKRLLRAARACVRLGRRRHGAALHRHARRHGSVARDHSGRNGQPAGLQPRHPKGRRGGGD